MALVLKNCFNGCGFKPQCKFNHGSTPNGSTKFNFFHFHIYYVPVSTAMIFKTFSFFNVDTIPRDIALKSVINYFMFHSLLSSTFSWINNTHYMLYISAIKIVLLFGFPTWKSNPEWTLVLVVCKVMCVIGNSDRVVEEGGKVEQILKDTLLSIPSPSPSVKIKIMGVKVCLRCKGKTF